MDRRNNVFIAPLINTSHRSQIFEGDLEMRIMGVIFD